MLQLNINIKTIRELSGLKQEQFAKLIKTKLSNLKTYETTDVKPKQNILASIADIAGVTVEQLKTAQLTHKEIAIKLPMDAAGGGENIPSIDILSLMRTNENISASNKECSESNNVLSRSNATLIDLLAKEKITDDDHKETFAEAVDMVYGLRDFLIDLTVEVTGKKEVDVRQAFRKKVKEASLRVGRNGTQP